MSNLDRSEVNNSSLDKDYTFLLGKKRRNWFIWQVGMPLFFIIMSWPISKWIAEVDHAFEKSLSGGDLILFSAMLLMGVMIELSYIRSSEKELENDRVLDWIADLALAFAFIVLFLYAVIKVDFIKYQFPVAGTAVDGRIQVYAYLSIICTLFSAGFASTGVWLAFEKQFRLIFKRRMME